MTRNSSGPDLRWRAWLGAGMLAGLLVFALSPGLRLKLGIFDYGMWFLDSYAVLAASDTHLAGIDPVQPMAFDVQQRAHIYSDWWYGVGRLGLTREDNFILGGVWVVAFVLTAWLWLRPRTARETAWNLALFLSPPVLLAVLRANNDLVIFVLLGITASLLAHATWPRLAGAIGLLSLATGLKYYPVAGVAALLQVRPPRRLVLAMFGAVIALGAILIDVGPAMGRTNIHPMPATVYTFGAPILFRDLGVTGLPAMSGGVLLLGAGTIVSLRFRPLPDPSQRAKFPAIFLLGTAVLLACFLAGISFAYRCMFFLFLAPWIWEQSERRWDARLGVGLIAAVVWLDGLCCLAMNNLVGPLDRQTIPRIQVVWRFATQPVTWLAMILLARWLLEAAKDAWRDTRANPSALD